eukprot:m.60713 g.60713  ORF g.60713 m.60713 type:complete len:109 (+) comp9522_c0_seq1:1225-1551(+)
MHSAPLSCLASIPASLHPTTLATRIPLLCPELALFFGGWLTNGRVRFVVSAAFELCKILNSRRRASMWAFFRASVDASVPPTASLVLLRVLTMAKKKNTLPFWGSATH